MSVEAVTAVWERSPDLFDHLARRERLLEDEQQRRGRLHRDFARQKGEFIDGRIDGPGRMDLAGSRFFRSGGARPAKADPRRASGHSVTTA